MVWIPLPPDTNEHLILSPHLHSARITHLQSLIHLALQENRIGGSIPEEIGLLKTRIRSLQLQGNRLNGLLPVFFKEPGMLQPCEQPALPHCA